MSKQWIAAAFALPLLWAPLALAQDAPAGGEWHQKMCTEHYARKTARLAYLEAKLGLTEPQRAVWNKWRQTQLDAADQRRTACLQRQHKEGAARPTAVEREARMEKYLSTRLQQLQASRPALQALYDALTPDQKALFDEAARRHRHHRHGHLGWRGREGHSWRGGERRGWRADDREQE